MQKWKNEKHNSLPNSIAKRIMFLEMQNFWLLSLFIISSAGYNFFNDFEYHWFMSDC